MKEHFYSQGNSRIKTQSAGPKGLQKLQTGKQEGKLQEEGAQAGATGKVRLLGQIGTVDGHRGQKPDRGRLLGRRQRALSQPEGSGGLRSAAFDQGMEKGVLYLSGSPCCLTDVCAPDSDRIPGRVFGQAGSRACLHFIALQAESVQESGAAAQGPQGIRALAQSTALARS